MNLKWNRIKNIYICDGGERAVLVVIIMRTGLR